MIADPGEAWKLKSLSYPFFDFNEKTFSKIIDVYLDKNGQKL